MSFVEFDSYCRENEFTYELHYSPLKLPHYWLIVTTGSPEKDDQCQELFTNLDHASLVFGKALMELKESPG